MKTKLVMVSVIFLLIGVFGIVSASTTLTIKGKIVDQITGLPISGAKLISAYELSPSEIETDSSGNFQFTITDDFKIKEGPEAGNTTNSGNYNFYNPNYACYDYAQIGFQKNYEVWQNGLKAGTYGLALIKYKFDEEAEVTEVIGKTIIDVGEIKMSPRAHLATQSDIESSMEVQYKLKNLQGYNGGGNANYKTYHASTAVLPLDYDVLIKFTEENGIQHESTTFHVPADAKCKTINLKYENGNSEWTVGDVSEGGAQSLPNIIELDIRKGWNLIPFNEFDDLMEDSEIKQEDIVVEYLYFSGYNKYIKVYPESYRDEIAQEVQKLGFSEQTMQEYQKYLINAGAWVYSKKSGKLRANGMGDLEGLYSHKKVELKTGWNFKTISPSMKNKKFSEIKGNCNIQRVAEWNADSQEWEVRNFADVAQVSISNGDVNNVAVFKVDSDCKFGDSSQSSSINPPAIPA